MVWPQANLLTAETPNAYDDRLVLAAPEDRPSAGVRLAGWRADFDPSAVRPVDAIARIRAPILLLHGDRDEIIAIDHARALERAADGRAKLVVLEGLGHNTPREDATYEAVARFLADAFASRP